MARRIVIPAIDLVNPSVDLERLKDGRANWTLKFKQPAQSGRWTLDLHEIAFAQGNLGYYDQQKQFDLSAVIDTLGQPIPFGAVMKQQEALAHHESAKAVGPAGQRSSRPRRTPVRRSRWFLHRVPKRRHAPRQRLRKRWPLPRMLPRRHPAARSPRPHQARQRYRTLPPPPHRGGGLGGIACIGGLGARGHHRRRHLHDRLDRQGDLQEGQGRRHGQDRQFAGRAGRATSVSGSGRFALWRYAWRSSAR